MSREIFGEEVPERARSKSIVVIPARLGSTRLPEKLLLRDTGKTVLQHTYETASRARLPSAVVVAVDHERLLREVERFGGRAIMTDPNAASGTDRLAEVAVSYPQNIFVNVQGDEPEIAPEAIDFVIEILQSDPAATVATLATRIRDKDDLENPNCVKVVCDHRGRAMYFSRSIIPHPRTWDESLLEANPPIYLHHLGIYAYRREFLLSLSHLPPSPLEQVEKLEQLRFLQAGNVVQVGLVASAHRGIDTMADYQAFVNRQRNGTMS